MRVYCTQVASLYTDQVQLFHKRKCKQDPQVLELKEFDNDGDVAVADQFIGKQASLFIQ